MSINLQDTSLPAKIWNDVNMLLLLSYCVIWMKYLNNNALILYLFFKLIKNTTSQQIMHILLDSRGHILEYETFQNETLCEVHIYIFHWDRFTVYTNIMRETKTVHMFFDILKHWTEYTTIRFYKCIISWVKCGSLLAGIFQFFRQTAMNCEPAITTTIYFQMIYINFPCAGGDQRKIISQEYSSR